ncbi:MAG: polysaccharide polymerase [Hydrogenophilales bacterium 17-64-65]|jgi:putative polymerase|nr:MAG: polysaccharide polymerase [Hydrogenophilales bacterium 16-64-40]OZA32101.1 MAG: polysaccharide polymerase [Hydrogenophilales bacterium 17-64-65]HQT33822.1 polysaccharide polymerase [Thiobacillus sp.]
MRLPSLSHGVALARPDALVSTKLISAILIGSVVYQAVLALVHTHLFRASALAVAAAEFAIYLACLLVLAKRIRLEFVAIVALVLAYLLLLSIFRNALEFKGFRDVIIPLLFFWLGRHVADIGYADRLLKLLVSVVLVFAFFELFFLDQYTRLLNIFSYYVSTGTVTVTTNFITDSALNLNGLRPEGIGRTIFPSLLGSHRISSVFLEPVSLGNFSVIVAAWGLSKPRTEYKQMLFFLLSAITLIALSDSRYGLIVVTSLIVMRITVTGRFNTAAILLPFVSMLVLVLIGLFFEGRIADNIMGRLFWTGNTLLGFDVEKMLGVQGFNMPYGDMGYAYLLSRWGVLLCIALWVGLWMVKMPDERGVRFRAYAALYISLILTVSGTSFFALKTAGLLWFLMGSCTYLMAKKTPPSYGADTPKVSGRELSYAY